MLRVTPDVLTPRPDTETILDVALAAFAEHRRFRMLDLGVGSGAILLAILAERPAATGLGVDVSEEALAVARDNAATPRPGGPRRLPAQRLDRRAGGRRASTWWSPTRPTSRAPMIETLEPEVRDHEPRLALDGGADGLDAYRLLAPEILRVLRPGGLFAVEIGYDQAAAVEALFREAGAEGVRTIKDLAIKDRVVTRPSARRHKKALGKGSVRIARSGSRLHSNRWCVSGPIGSGAASPAARARRPATPRAPARRPKTRGLTGPA